MIIRPGLPSDRPFLRTLYLRARKISWPWADSSDWQLEDFDAATLNEQVWVAEIDGHRVGFASVWESDNFLHNLFVDPDWQGHGVGTALLKQVQSTFTSTGALKCLIQNATALHFYHQHGWHTEARGASPDGDYWLLHFRINR
ncbi:GNAT family N-acetyltransferase [Scandinavium sp. M-37]|uniref:GNAT family N-acetyltransferase n=1 Tax=Scandinavium sp. M-37 TaxID=3373077 RepID=UPI003744E7E9